MKDSWHARKDYTTDNHYNLHDQLEDGTLRFHSIFALGSAMDVHVRLFGDDCMQTISRHVAYLSKRLYDGILQIRHLKGQPVCMVHKHAISTYGDSLTQGGTLAFNVLTDDGTLIPYSEVEALADQRHIFVRSGGLCNPGGIASFLRLEPREMKRAYSAGHRCGHATQIVSQESLPGSSEYL